MNEWTPKEFYSGPLTTDQAPQTTVYRQYWDENWNQPRITSNLKTTVNYYKIRDYQSQSIAVGQNFGEDLGIPPSPSSKKKKNGISDPRFKRVINTETRKNETFNTEKIVANLTRALEDRMNEQNGITDKVISYLKAPNEASLYAAHSVKKFRNEQEEEDETNYGQDLSEIVTRDIGFEASTKCLRNCNEIAEYQKEANFLEIQNFESLRGSNKNKSSSNMKRSASDCTLHTKGEEMDDDNVHIIKPFPSASRLNKVHNWMNECKLPAEKRRSVITVIGQTQNKPFSKILNEINQRRKLAKELDKHALCKAIMESAENQTDVKNLIAQVDFVLPDGKIIYSTEKVYLRRENSKYQIEKDSDEIVSKCLDGMDATDKLRKRCEMIPERDSSITQVGRRNKAKRSSRKLSATIKEKIYLKDKMRLYCAKLASLLFWPSLVILLLIMCAYAIYHKTRYPYPYMLSDFLKPKSRAWYKKILL